MTTKTKKTGNTARTNRPSHIVYHVSGDGEDSKNWMPVGAAWPHKDAKGFNIRLDVLPVSFDGNLTIRERNTESEGQ